MLFRILCNYSRFFDKLPRCVAVNFRTKSKLIIIINIRIIINCVKVVVDRFAKTPLVKFIVDSQINRKQVHKTVS